MSQQWHLELGVATSFVLIFMGVSVFDVVLLAGIFGIFVRSFRVRTRRRARLRIHRQRQSGARTVVATQQARQNAAESMGCKDNLVTDCAFNPLLTKPTTDGDLTERMGESRTTSLNNDFEDVDSQQAEARTRNPLRGAVLPLFAPFLAGIVTLWQLAVVFLRVGSVTFGGGFVMIPQIETDVVKVHQWLTQQEFADGVVFGQITPGPILITATFVGFKVAGILGAFVATIAAFLPSFLMTLLAGTSLSRFRTNSQVQAFLAGVAPAVVGMIAAAGVSLARSGLNSTLSFGVATLAFLLMLRARLNPLFIILGCGVLQFLVSRFLI